MNVHGSYPVLSNSCNVLIPMAVGDMCNVSTREYVPFYKRSSKQLITLYQII